MTGINFSTYRPEIQAVLRRNASFIRRFIEQDIIKKFDTPKRIITYCSKEFNFQDTQAYLSL